jgi:hypothetical protein
MTGGAYPINDRNPMDIRFDRIAPGYNRSRISNLVPHLLIPVCTYWSIQIKIPVVKKIVTASVPRMTRGINRPGLAPGFLAHSITVTRNQISIAIIWAHRACRGIFFSRITRYQQKPLSY